MAALSTEADLLEEEDELGEGEEEEEEGDQEAEVRFENTPPQLQLGSFFVFQIEDGDAADEEVNEKTETGGKEQVTQPNGQLPTAATVTGSAEEKATDSKPSSTSEPQTSVQPLPTKLSDTEVRQSLLLVGVTHWGEQNAMRLMLYYAYNNLFEGSLLGKMCVSIQSRLNKMMGVGVLCRPAQWETTFADISTRCFSCLQDKPLSPHQP